MLGKKTLNTSAVKTGYSCNPLPFNRFNNELVTMSQQNIPRLQSAPVHHHILTFFVLLKQNKFDLRSR